MTVAERKQARLDKPEPFRIAGVQIDLGNESFKKVKSITALKKMGHFEHLPNDQREAAEQQLAQELGITEKQEIETLLPQ